MIIINADIENLRVNNAFHLTFDYFNFNHNKSIFMVNINYVILKGMDKIF